MRRNLCPLWLIIGVVLSFAVSACRGEPSEERTASVRTPGPTEEAQPPSVTEAPQQAEEVTGEPVEKPPEAGPDQEKEGEPSSADERVFKYNNLGIAFLEQYNYQQAAGQFRRALALAPNFAVSRINLAIALYNSGQREQALRELQQAQDLGSRAPQLSFMLGLIYKERGEFDRALQYFSEVRKIDPNDVATNYNIGMVRARTGQQQQAVENYKRVIAVEPYNASARYGLAMSLLRSGHRDQGQQAMLAFQKLQKKDYATQIGQQYMEQGKYALAIEKFSARPPQPIGVSFSDVAESAGIRFSHGAEVSAREPVLGRRIRVDDYSLDYARRHLIPALGSGAVFFDFNNDKRLDIYLVNCSAEARESNALYRNNGNGTFTDVTGQAGVGFAGLGMGAVAGDYDNDGWTDLFVTNYGRNILYRNHGDGRFTDATAQTGVGGHDDAWSLGAAFVDYDHDGDLDIYVTNFVDPKTPPASKADRRLTFPDDFSGQANRLYRNNGNGTFTELASQARLAFRGKSTSVVCTDYDNHRDIDFVLVNYDASAKLLSNNRVGTFKDVTGSVGFTSDGKKLGASVGDFNKDGFSDIFIARVGGSNLLFESRGNGTFRRRQIPVDRPANRQQPTANHHPISWMGQFFDYDNDGYLDLLIINGGTSQEEASAQRLQLLRNRGNGQFQDVSSEVGLHQLPPSLGRGAAFGDYDNDGDVDVLVVQNGGRPWLLKNNGGNRNHWVKVNPLGVRSNKLGIGAKVEVKAGRLWQTVEISGGSGYLSQSSPEIIFGLGNHQDVDFVRLLWPGGVLQSEMAVALNQSVQIKELDRKGTSCPILYAWDGQHYRFVTDFLGGSAIGYRLGANSYNTPDTDEYVKLTSSQLQMKDGTYRLKMNNQLEEVIMFDQTRLLVIDHPTDVDVFPNERLMPEPPYPKFKMYVVKAARPPVRAFDDKGNNILPLISAIDRTYPDDFKRLPFKGYSQEHSIILDLGPVRPQASNLNPRTSAVNKEQPAILLLTAWIDYADSSSNLAASQAGVKLVPPYLQVPDENGRWVTVMPSMGFPAGLPKTMVVDLRGKFLTDDFRVKIVTSMNIYWDQILLSDQVTVIDNPSAASRGQSSPPSTSTGPASTVEHAPLKVMELRPTRADLQWRGYPKEYSPDGKRPLIYDYSRIEPHAPWKTFIGSATQYGDVTELLREKDDMYVIALHGDEISLEFDARHLPPLPSGWTRDFFVYADGFGKDMDLNSARPDTIEPLPFHGMSSYPYPETEGYPAGAEHDEYLKRYNRRHYRDPLEETDAKKTRRRKMM